MQLVDDPAHHLEGIPLRVESEPAAAVHVTNARPHGLEGDVGDVVVHHFGDLKGVAAAEASKRTSPVFARVTEKENGSFL